MKTLTYNRDSMLKAAAILNSITISGTSNIRMLAELANILDSGTPGETFEKEEKIDGDLVGEKVQSDKLAE